MCDKAVSTYPLTIKFVPKCYKTAIRLKKCLMKDSCLFAFDSLPEWYETQEMCDRVVSEDSSLRIQ